MNVNCTTLCWFSCFTSYESSFFLLFIKNFKINILSKCIYSINWLWIVYTCELYCHLSWTPGRLDSISANSDNVNEQLTSPLVSDLMVSFPLYHSTVRFRAGATLIMSHCSWNSLSSTTELRLPARRMETLSGVSGEEWGEFQNVRSRFEVNDSKSVSN